MSSAIDAILSDSEDEISGDEKEKEYQPTAGTSKPTERRKYEAVEEDESSDEEVADEDDDESEDSEEELEEGAELDDVAAKPVEVEATVSANTTFESLNIGSWLVKQLGRLRIAKPTPVQAHCIPKVLEGCDVLGCAKTGTGKTLAFALPILQQLAVDPYGIYALVLTPTRELAFQIADQFIALGKPISLKISVIIGGRCMVQHATELTARPHIVVATPGRLADQILSDPDGIGKLFKNIKFFVLDEADRMLDGQYNDQLKTIFEAIPKKRQTLLFSATITSAINQLHKVSVKKPYFFEDKSDIATVEKLDQKYVLCPVAVKDAYLVYVVKNYCERNESSSVIIFAQTCRECQALAYMFLGLGFQVGSLHSQIPQRSRMASLAAFRSKTLRVLISTDVASRGLDIPHVDLVVNHNVPQCPKTYVHRVGRSARAGRYGSALTFITQYDIVLLQAVEELVGKKLEELKVNEKKVATYVTKVLVSKKEAELKLEQQSFGERKEINKRKELLMAGMPEEEVDKIIEEAKLRRISGAKRRIEKLDRPAKKSRQNSNANHKLSDKKAKKKGKSG